MYICKYMVNIYMVIVPKYIFFKQIVGHLQEIIKVCFI